MKVRRAELNDLGKLVEFTAAEAREAEGHEKDTKTLRNGINAALEDRSIAMYWVLMNQNNEPVTVRGKASLNRLNLLFAQVPVMKAEKMQYERNR